MTKCPDELDMLVETLSVSDIQLLNSSITKEHSDSTNRNVAKNVTNASDVSCYGICSSHTADHTSSTSSFAVTTEIDLKQLKYKNKNRNTIKSTVTWINRFEAWQKVRGINNELENIPKNELDHVLQSFFAEIRKSDGTEYKP